MGFQIPCNRGEKTNLNQMIEEEKEKTMTALVVKGVLAQYLQKNTFDDLLLIISDLATERGRHFTFYQSR